MIIALLRRILSLTINYQRRRLTTRTTRLLGRRFRHRRALPNDRFIRHRIHRSHRLIGPRLPTLANRPIRGLHTTRRFTSRNDRMLNVTLAIRTTTKLTTNDLTGTRALRRTSKLFNYIQPILIRGLLLTTPHKGRIIIHKRHLIPTSCSIQGNDTFHL